MAVDDELKNYIKAVRVEHDRRIDETYQRKGEQGAVSLSSRFEDEVSLIGGAHIWDRIFLHPGNRVDFSGSSINASTNLYYTGRHIFEDKLSLKSGLYVADSMKSDFGDYGSIKATNDTIRIAQSTITGDATFTGNDKFSGHITLQSSTEFQDDITVADSLDVDLGSHGEILARHDTINVTDSVIKGYHSVQGNVYYEDRQHFLDDIVAHDGVSLIGALSGANSLSHDFGRNCKIAAQYDTLDFRNSYVRFDGATISANSISGGVGSSSGVILDTVPSTVEGAMWYVR